MLLPWQKQFLSTKVFYFKKDCQRQGSTKIIKTCFFCAINTKKKSNKTSFSVNFIWSFWKVHLKLTQQQKVGWKNCSGESIRYWTKLYYRRVQNRNICIFQTKWNFMKSFLSLWWNTLENKNEIGRIERKLLQFEKMKKKKIIINFSKKKKKNYRNNFDVFNKLNLTTPIMYTGKSFNLPKVDFWLKSKNKIEFNF